MKLSKLKPYLRLTRPPNLLTAVSDIWAGVALSGIMLTAIGYGEYLWPLILLSLASIFLYAGGVVLNDVFDANIDKTERPERPLPSGQVSLSAALIFGAVLLLAGIILSAWVGWLSGLLALLTALAAVIYDRWGKHHNFLGPVNMGLCRGLNLLLGMSILPASILVWGWVAVVPVIYIAAITIISRGEVYGGQRPALMAAFAFYILVIILVALVAFLKHQLPLTLVFLLLFGIMIFPPLRKALADPSGPRIGKAVKAGVLALILLNASWVAAGMGITWAVGTALLLPLSIWVAKYFAVT